MNAGIDTSLTSLSHRVWLIAARVAWLAIFGLVLALYVGGFSTRVAYLPTLALPPDDYPLRISPATSAALAQLGLSMSFYTGYVFAIEIILALSCLIIGTLIFLRRSANIAAIMISLLIICLGCSESSFTGTLAHINELWRVSRNLLQITGIALGLIVFYVFPDGRFIPRWTRLLAAIYVGIIVLWFFFPHAPFNPMPDASFNDTPIASTLFLFAWNSTGVFALIYRYRQVATATQRQQMKWAVYGLIIGFVAVMVRYLTEAAIRQHQLVSIPPILFDLIGPPIYWLVLAGVPICFANALLRHRLWDVDFVINRTLVYATLTGSIIVLYGLVVGALSIVWQNRASPAISLIATGLVAALFQPLRTRLQHGVNRLMYGDRDDPYTVLVRLDQRLEGALATTAVLPTIVTTVCDALKLPYAAIELKKDDTFVVAAAAGVPGEVALILPMVYQGEPIGSLLLSSRHPRESFSDTERRLLMDLAHQASAAAYAVRLATELQRAREHLVIAREEERQRICRDLHDRLGPQLASQIWMLDMMGRWLEHDLAKAVGLIDELKSRSQSAVADIRRLVDGLRPPALDELGLVGALQEHITQYQHSGLPITLQAPRDLPPLPAAVEVAAYRIVQEALTNVIRHAHAGRCEITLKVQDGLYLAIQNDDQGIVAMRSSDLGMTNIRERAEELSGTVFVEQGVHGGTRIIARLPLP